MDSEKINSQMMIDLLSLFKEYDYHHVNFFINSSGNVGITIESPYVSVFIDRGHYHLALSDNRYQNWLSLTELKSLLEGAL